MSDTIGATGGDHAEGVEDCQRCGEENPPWAAASPLWNAVMRGGSINGDEGDLGIICARCFMVLAEERGIASIFRVTAEQVDVELETTTPSGRVWDEAQFRWVDPPSPSEQGETGKRAYKCPECRCPTNCPCCEPGRCRCADLEPASPTGEAGPADGKPEDRDSSATLFSLAEAVCRNSAHALTAKPIEDREAAAERVAEALNDLARRMREAKP